MPRPAKPIFVGPVRSVKNANGRIAHYEMTTVSGPLPVVLKYPGKFQGTSARHALIAAGAHKIPSEEAVQAIAHLAALSVPSDESEKHAD